MHLVSVSGLDGAGKTCLVRTLRTKIEENTGASVRDIAILKDLKHRFEYLRRQLYKPKGKGVISLADIASEIEGYVHSLLMAPEKGMSYLLFDRYIIDFMVTQVVMFGFTPPEVSAAFSRLPWPDLAVYITIPPETAWERILERGPVSSFERPEMLIKKHNIYESLVREHKFLVVDHRLSKLDAACVILNNLGLQQSEA